VEGQSTWLGLGSTAACTLEIPWHRAVWLASHSLFPLLFRCHSFNPLLQFELLAYEKCWGSIASVTVNGQKKYPIYGKDTNQAGKR
jgi:hypothetical protein